MTRKQAEAQERLRAAMGTMVAVNAASVEPLLRVTQGGEGEWLRAHLLDMAAAPEVILDGVELSEAVARLRPVARRLIGSP